MTVKWTDRIVEGGSQRVSIHIYITDFGGEVFCTSRLQPNTSINEFSECDIILTTCLTRSSRRAESGVMLDPRRLYVAINSDAH